MYSVRQLKWSEVHNKWNDIKFPEPYQQYLQDTFGITITEGRVIWNHVVEVVEVTIDVTPGGGGKDYSQDGTWKKKERKKIKLIFIMGELHKQEEKEVSDIMSPQIVSDIRNKLEEQLKTKITLTDVQIIKG